MQNQDLISNQMKEVRRTHQTIADPNGSDTHIVGVVIITGIITLSLIALGSVCLLASWLL